MGSKQQGVFGRLANLFGGKAKPANGATAVADRPARGREAVMREIPVRPAPPRQSAGGPSRRVNFGLDFGTSGTKVLARVEGATAASTQFYVLSPLEGPSLIFPSTVALEAGGLLFGAAAESSRVATATVRSFKMNLPSEAGLQQSNWRRAFQLADSTLTAEQVSTLFLAWVLGESKRRVRQMIGRADLSITLNAAAPLDQMNASPQLAAMFHRIAYRALLLADQVKQRIRVGEALGMLAEIEAQPIPDAAESPVSIFPETHATMTAYIVRPGARRGNYATVDVGAGTTDVAFFWFHATDGEPEACYYAARSGFVGMDDVDHLLGEAVGQSAGATRRSREQKRIDISTHLERVQPALDEIYKQYRKAFGNTYERCLGQRQWVEFDGRAKYTLFLVGGGASCREVATRLREVLPILDMRRVNVEVLAAPADLQVVMGEGRSRSLAELRSDEGHLLLLAHGLAHRAVDIPRYENSYSFQRIRRLAEQPSHEEKYAR